MKKILLLIPLFSFLLFSNLYAIKGISILANSSLLENPLAKKSISDCIMLLEQACNCKVKINDRSQEILLVLPSLNSDSISKTSSFGKNLPYPYLNYVPHYYTWTSKRVGKQIHLELETPSFEGVSFGLYGLLQEQLWFSFYHPRESIIPDLHFWPLTEEFTWEVEPRFDKKGFHLHTMHPLELTEPLLNPECPDGIAQVKEYVDWLARNQQNYFEFNLLETEDLERWANYIKPAMTYAQSRGVLIGVDISLHMTQQKAFMLYKTFPATLKGKQQQIKKNLEILFIVDWDVIAMEASTTEFTKGNATQTQKMQLFVTDLVVNKYGAKLAGREHVVKHANTLGEKTTVTPLSEQQMKLDANRAVFIHTVMFYGLVDQKAPVYENENLLHMLDILKEEQKKRETWYYPESAYWITFDNSVPMLLMPYLQTRLDDILLMDSLGVKGHLTFSSGWEWGYWLIDWSIARWSWKSTFNGRKMEPRPTQFLVDIFHNQEIVDKINVLAELQQKYIKDEELIRYMVAQTVTDELSGPFNLELHPRPSKSYKWMRNKSNKEDIKILYSNVINPLLKFAKEGELQIKELKEHDYLLSSDRAVVLEELINALSITQLRARHKAYTLSLLLAKRQKALDEKTPDTVQEKIDLAIAVREEAQDLVKKQEQNYRYPLGRIARPIEKGGSTAYDFGYLFPVSDLHFWKREEQQIIQDKYGPFFMSIWDIPRIMGVVD
jgi:hypothetical protein